MEAFNTRFFSSIFFGLSAASPRWPALLLLALPLAVFSQNKPAEKANELFQLEQYAPAAGLYEVAIAEMAAKGKPSRNMLNLQTKLAYCYRMNNAMAEAEALYAQIVQNDRAKADTYYFYGETLMANEKYDEAKKWFADYQKLVPDDAKGPLMAEACDKVQFIQPQFQYVAIQEFAHNSEADDNAAVAWQGGIVFSSDRNSGIKLMKEKSGWTGRDYLDVYFSEKKQDGQFGEPKQFSSKLSELNRNTCNTAFSPDGTEVYFTRNNNVLNKQKTYNLQLFRAAANGGDRWKDVEKLPFCSSNFNYMHPAVSPDGKMLFFATNAAGGQGGTDIWVSIRESAGWSKPEALGPTVNTPANEGFPFMDAKGRLYFCSKGHVGYGGFDIFFTEMTGAGIWKKPVNLGKPINSPLDDISVYVAEDRQTGMFTSCRSGGDDDIFLFQVLDGPPLETLPETPMAEQVPTVLEVGPTVQETAETTPPTEPEVVETAVETIVETPTEAVFQAPAPTTEPIPMEPILAEGQTSEAPVVLENEMPETVENEALSPAEIPKNEVVVTTEAVTESPAVETVQMEERAVEQVVLVETATPESPLLSQGVFLEKATRNDLRSGERFRLENAVFDPQIWQLTPKVSKALDDLVAVLRRFPGLQIEVISFTESLGDNESNLRISQYRAETVVAYITREGIAANRLKAMGYGETMPLNHCRDGVTCGMDEHLFNQRIEVKIISAGKTQ